MAGLAIGSYVGFIVSFSSCFKQQCSSFEPASIYVIPLLFFNSNNSFGFSNLQKRARIVKIITQAKNSTWIIVGVLVIFCTVVSVYSVIDDNMRNNEMQKAALVGG